MISVLNNLSAMSAENSLSMTQSSLQKTLTQLSTGLRINTGSDDAAGLSIANGMQANIAALTQSVQNATNGVGMLQTADGALSQVTSLLNRAVTLATEAANGDITTSGSTSQSAALNTEFQSILSEINQIGQTTDFNGENVFTSGAPASFSSTQGSASSPLTTSSLLGAGTVTISDPSTSGNFVFTASATSTVADLQTAITNAQTAGTLGANVTASISTSGTNQGQLVIATSGTGNSLSVSDTTSGLGAFSATSASDNVSTTFISDATQTSALNTQITTTITALSSTTLSLASNTLLDQTHAAAALTAINNAISQVSAQRGQIGASVNRLTAASAVMTNQISNLTSASNGIMNADIGKTVANMTQYNVLQSTGMAALQQANQAQQAVLKLVQ